MPRRGRGSRQQAIQVAPDQTFGERQEAIEAQEVIPLPRQPDPQPQAQQPAPQQQPVAPQQSLADLLTAFQPNPIALGAASQRPDEPLTAGLSSGAGPGPEAITGIRRATLTSDTLQFLADVTGDPAMRRYADRSRLIGD